MMSSGHVDRSRASKVGTSRRRKHTVPTLQPLNAKNPPRSLDAHTATHSRCHRVVAPVHIPKVNVSRHEGNQMCGAPGRATTTAVPNPPNTNTPTRPHDTPRPPQTPAASYAPICLDSHRSNDIAFVRHDAVVASCPQACTVKSCRAMACPRNGAMFTRPHSSP